MNCIVFKLSYTNKMNKLPNIPNIHTINFEDDIWYNVSDIVNYIGYTPFELKWPHNTIVITNIK